MGLDLPPMMNDYAILAKATVVRQGPDRCGRLYLLEDHGTGAGEERPFLRFVYRADGSTHEDTFFPPFVVENNILRVRTWSFGIFPRSVEFLLMQYESGDDCIDDFVRRAMAVGDRVALLF